MGKDGSQQTEHMQEQDKSFDVEQHHQHHTANTNKATN